MEAKGKLRTEIIFYPGRNDFFKPIDTFNVKIKIDAVNKKTQDTRATHISRTSIVCQSKSAITKQVTVSAHHKVSIPKHPGRNHLS